MWVYYSILRCFYHVCSQEHFEKGRRDAFLVTRDAGFGALKLVNVYHEGGSFGAGWFLDKITITDKRHVLEDGSTRPVTFVFPCNNWVANKSKTGRKTSLQSSAEEFAKFNTHLPKKLGAGESDKSSKALSPSNSSSRNFHGGGIGGSERRTHGSVVMEGASLTREMGEKMLASDVRSQSPTTLVFVYYIHFFFSGSSAAQAASNVRSLSFEACHSDSAELWSPDLRSALSRSESSSPTAGSTTSSTLVLRRSTRLGGVRYLALWVSDRSHATGATLDKVYIEEEGSNRRVEFPHGKSVQKISEDGKKTILKPARQDKIKLFPMLGSKATMARDTFDAGGKSGTESSRGGTASQTHSTPSRSGVQTNGASSSSSTANQEGGGGVATHTQPKKPQGPKVLDHRGDWQQVEQYYEKKKTHVIYYFNVKTKESRWDATDTPFAQ